MALNEIFSRLDFCRFEETIRKDLHIFKCNGGWFAYGRVSGIALQLTEREATALRYASSGGFRDSTEGLQQPSHREYAQSVLSVIRLLAKRRLIRESLGPFRSFLVLVTDECNLACRYCYCRFAATARIGHMSSTTAENVVDSAVSLGVKSIAFFGGEPLLNLIAIKTIVEKAHNASTDFDFSMTTNATLLTPEIADYLSDCNVRVSVSIDGPKSVHDITRVYPDGNSTYEDVVRGIELLRDRSILDIIEVTHSARHPSSLSANIKALKHFDCPITCTCVEGKSDAPFIDDIVSGDRLKVYYDELFAELSEPQTKGHACAISGAAELAASLLSNNSICRPYICSGVMTRATVTPDGRMYPCPETVADQYCFGSVNDDNITTYLNEQRHRALDQLRKGPRIRKHWFGDLLDTCIVRLQRAEDGDLKFCRPDEISDCLEHVIAKLGKEFGLEKLDSSDV